MNQPHEHPADKRLGKLLATLERGELTDAERNEFNELLRTDEAARKFYLEHVELQALLHARLSEPLALPAADQEPEPMTSQPVTKSLCDAKNKTALVHVYCFFAQPTPFSMSVAALVIGLIITVMAFTVPPFYRAVTRQQAAPKPPQLVAYVTQTQEAQWPAGETQRRRGTRLLDGDRIILELGFAEVTYVNGVKVVLQGPCDYRLETSNAAMLTSGKLSASVPHTVHGFSVDTPVGMVTDLGTEFGIALSDNETVNVIVYEGAVQIDAALDAGPRQVRLTAGESAIMTPEDVVKRQGSQADFPRIVRRLGNRDGEGGALVDWDFSVLGMPGDDNRKVGGDARTHNEAAVHNLLGPAHANASSEISVSAITGEGSVIYSSGEARSGEVNVKDFDLPRGAGDGVCDGYLQFAIRANSPGSLNIDGVLISSWRNAIGAPDGMAIEISVNGGEFSPYGTVQVDPDIADFGFDEFTFNEPIVGADAVTIRLAPRKVKQGSTGNLHINRWVVFGTIDGPRKREPEKETR